MIECGHRTPGRKVALGIKRVVGIELDEWDGEQRLAS
jgi:hypothetical protein